ncbi:MAG: hypothetical protein J5486_04780 [Bacteroidaceae bacterium]|nr:hypothetical protein [Bacteroidaceae bacterium]
MYRRITVIALCLLLAFDMSAQRRRNRRAAAPEPSPMELARKAISEYRFDDAENILSKEIANLERRRKSTTALTTMRETAQDGWQKLMATERIVVIDSIVVGVDEALRAIRLSQGSGRLDTYARSYHTRDSLGCTLYENDLGNRRYVAIPTEDGGSLLAVTDLIGNEWQAPVPLTGLHESIRQNYPFLMADGVTLYYAATGDESMGGYDIFVTRADGNEGECLTPENIGFPFNSTANDYLLAIDEQASLGWFITDRNQPADSVCVYTFIPNDTRQTYGEDTDPALLRRLAQLTCIADTWDGNEQAVDAAKQRLTALRTSSRQQQQHTETFRFVVNDNIVYTQLTDFRNPTAREKAQEWLTMKKNNSTDELMLQRLRDNYAKASAADRAQLAVTIRQLEASYYPRIQQLNELAKEIRRLELGVQ